MTMTDKTTNTEEYNGWTNMETWALALHLSNNQGDYSEACENAKDFLELAEASNHEHGEDRVRREALYAMTQWIESWAQDVYASVLGADEDGDVQLSSEAARNLISDVGSLWRVNFREIAEDYINEAREALS